jgi:O-succinylbenzoate synthase
MGANTTRFATLLEGPLGWGEFSPLPGYPSAASDCWSAAVEAALRPWPSALRSRVPINALVPALPPDEASLAAVAAVGQGYGCIKVKVGDAASVDRVAAVRCAVGPAVLLRVDANGAWGLEEAVRALDALARYDLELAEQPVPSIEELALVRRRVSVPIAADECIRGIDDARRLAALGAADAVVLKTQALGGVWASLRIAEAAGVPVIVS